MNEIIYLEVPYSEKEQVKGLGAWWDPVAKKWFIPKGREVQPFQQWLPDKNENETGKPRRD